CALLLCDACASRCRRVPPPSTCPPPLPFFFGSAGSLRHLPSFPTRRSFDLGRAGHAVFETAFHERVVQRLELERALRTALVSGEDRKSTRLNSSHAKISYAVFRLKKNNAIASTARPAAASGRTIPCPRTP